METTTDVSPFVAYYRVSTIKQGESGLGLDAQKTAVRAHLAAHGGVLVGEYVEIESGRKKARPMLTAAFTQCRRERARLVIAKLDRLARNVAFIANLMESRVDFVACDNPHASRLVLHMLAAFAEHEAGEISRRTKDALAAAKARGAVLGRNGVVLAAANMATADDFARSMALVIEGLREEGITTVRAICAELNARGVLSARGGAWHLPVTHRLLRRIVEIT